MNARIRIYALLSVLIILDCSHFPSDRGVRAVLDMAGDNRSELEIVLRDCKSSGDRYKYKAARHLIAGMAESYTLTGPSLDLYCRQLDSFYRRPDASIFTLREFNDSVFATDSYFSDLEKIPDAQTISSQYLINHIDTCLELWRTSPWARNLPFEGFCEYILPYRVGNERLEDWHSFYRMTFGQSLDSLLYSNDASLEEFCATVNNILNKSHLYNGYPSGKPSLPPSLLTKIMGGACDDYVNLFMHVARAYGVPVAEDYTPQWGNHSQGHTWVAVIDGEENRHFAIGEPLFHERKKPFTWQMVKAFRKPHGMDVTSKYVRTTDVTVTDLDGRKSPVAALSVFDDRNWVPVCASPIRRRMARFSDMGYPAVFLPVYQSIAGTPTPASYPVLVDSNANQRILQPDLSDLREVHLKRKFLETRVWRWVDSLRGGHFELAGNPTFADAYHLDIPDSIGYNYQTLTLPDGAVKTHYFRYVPDENGSGNIAEIELYAPDGKRIHGEVIGTYFSGDKSHAMNKAFDGNPLTFAQCKPYQNTPWIGLDLGRDADIARICFLPRSDDNFIRDGDEYELCYWDGKWVSLGFRTGSRSTQELVYDNVPENALLLLHNHTRGKEERIFTYENGRQVWW